MVETEVEVPLSPRRVPVEHLRQQGPSGEREEVGEDLSEASSVAFRGPEERDDSLDTEDRSASVLGSLGSEHEPPPFHPSHGVSVRLGRPERQGHLGGLEQQRLALAEVEPPEEASGVHRRDRPQDLLLLEVGPQVVGQGRRGQPELGREPREDRRPLLGGHGGSFHLIEEPTPQIGGRRPLPSRERAPPLDQEGQAADHLVLVHLGFQLPDADLQLPPAPADAILVDLRHGLGLRERGLAEKDGADPVLAGPGQ